MWCTTSRTNGHSASAMIKRMSSLRRRLTGLRMMSVVFLFHSSVACSDSTNEGEAQAEPMVASTPEPDYEPTRAPQTTSRSNPDGYPDQMDERERAYYDEAPSSYGYSEEDREFMKEHGVTESEMRAAETLIGNPD